MSEDPYAYLEKFIQIGDTFRLNEILDEVVKLKLFLFSLRDKAII